MLDTFNIPTPQSANYQEFISKDGSFDWIKPRGVSMVRFMLIGKGGNGGNGSATPKTGGSGGGSGAITSWIGPAMFVPDELRITIDVSGSYLIYQQKNTIGYVILSATAGGNGGNVAGSGGNAMTNNYFGASGIFSSTAGQAGGDRAASISTSGTTPLSGGAGGASATSSAGSSVSTYYGYPTITGGAGTTGGDGKGGYSTPQSLFFASGGSGSGGSTTGASGTGGSGGLGSGGGGAGRLTSGSALGGAGGPGAVFVWSW